MKNIKSLILACMVMFAFAISAFSQAQNDSIKTNIKTITIKVKGINCQMDVKSIADNIQKLKGVNSCITEKPGAITAFKVNYDISLVDVKKIHEAVEGTAGCEDPNEKPYKIKK